MAFAIIVAAILGLAIGSFLTVVAERLGSNESFITGRSHCDHCKRVLTWWELIPLVGYMLVGGKCPSCKKPIPPVYNLFELITAAAFAGLIATKLNTLSPVILAADGLLIALMLVICFGDWRSQEFDARLAWFALAVVAILSVVKALLFKSTLPSLVVIDPFYRWLATPSLPLANVVLGGVVGAGVLGLIAGPSRGKWMGYGDVVIGGIIGLWLGYPFVIVALVLAVYSGAILGVTLLISRRIGRNHAIAFGPFLIIGALITYFWALPLARLMLHLLGGV